MGRSRTNRWQHAVWLGLLCAGSAFGQPGATGNEEDVSVLAELPIFSLGELRTQWLTDRFTAGETAARMAMDLQVVSLPGVDDGPKALRALATVLSNPASELAWVDAALLRTQAALAVHHATESAEFARSRRPAHARAQLRLAAAYLESVAQSADAATGAQAAVSQARAVSDEEDPTPHSDEELRAAAEAVRGQAAPLQ